MPRRWCVALAVHLAHEVGEVGAKRWVRASSKALTRVPRLKAGVRDLSHFVGEVYDGGNSIAPDSLVTIGMQNPGR